MRLELFAAQGAQAKIYARCFQNEVDVDLGVFSSAEAPSRRERYQQADTGPITAVEDQMAIRAIWQLLLVWVVFTLVVWTESSLELG